MNYRFAKLAVLACAVVLAMALAGCGNSSQAASSTQQEVEDTVITPYSFTHADRSLWFRLGNGNNNKYDEISKDAVAYLFVFEDGKLTYRSNWNTQLGKVCDMSDDEIIAMYKEGDEKTKAAFEQLDKSKTTEDKFYELLAPWDISAFTLSTDASGNNPVSEEIAFYNVTEKMSAMNITGAPLLSGSGSYDWKLTLTSPDESASQIYDSYFGGYTLQEQSNHNMPFVTKVEDPQHTSFALDPVGTDGVDAR